MTNVEKHTPIPWTYSPHHRDCAEGHIFSTGGDRMVFAAVNGTAAMKQAEVDTNAAFIVRAVNNFDQMLDALQAVANWPCANCGDLMHAEDACAECDCSWDEINADDTAPIRMARAAILAATEGTN